MLILSPSQVLFELHRFQYVPGWTAGFRPPRNKLLTTFRSVSATVRGCKRLFIDWINHGVRVPALGRVPRWRHAREIYWPYKTIAADERGIFPGSRFPAHIKSMIPLSVLDLAPVPEGSDAGQALRNSLDLARHVEALGFVRYWMAEHHNLPGIASAATAVALAHVGAGTDTLRIGAGGIMLPNHAPLLIAEQFGTLAALHPGRVELGLGRAPGSDQITARAVRRALLGGAENFPQDVVELMGYFRPAEPGQAVQAVPGAGLEVPIWILGSSLYGAQVAAYLGLPFAFASHFAPAMMMDAMRIYRERFRPSAQLSAPNIMLGITVVAAESNEEARFLYSSLQQSMLTNRTGRRG